MCGHSDVVAIRGTVAFVGASVDIFNVTTTKGDASLELRCNDWMSSFAPLVSAHGLSSLHNRGLTKPPRGMDFLGLRLNDFPPVPGLVSDEPRRSMITGKSFEVPSSNVKTTAKF